MNNKDVFFNHLAQTSTDPLGLHIEKAEGVFLYDKNNRRYFDLVAGFSVNNIGHNHPKVTAAIENQIKKYLHVIVFGEFLQDAQLEYAHLLTQHLAPSLNCIYFTNSGTEAVEGAIKLAKRATNRTEIVAFKKAYHGSTQGSLSMMGDEYHRNAFRPLIPGVRSISINKIADLKYITSQTACVIIEPIQGEAGVQPSDIEYLKALRQKCKETGTLLIFDEVQTGFGRTGSLFAYQQYGVVPDIIVLGKAIGGGMPLAAFVADKKIMDLLKENPILGHITTTGGHPVSCAAGLAAMKVLLESNVIDTVCAKEQLFKKLLQHPKIKEVRGKGLLMAVELSEDVNLTAVIKECINQGVLIDYFIFSKRAFRISPPLTISESEIAEACSIILNVLQRLS